MTRIIFSGLRVGKTEALRRLAEQIGQVQHAVRQLTGIWIDEATTLPVAAVVQNRERRDRSAFHRGGRYRKPPLARQHRPLLKGQALMRDRTGKLVERHVAPSIKQTEVWGIF